MKAFALRVGITLVLLATAVSTVGCSTKPGTAQVGGTSDSPAQEQDRSFLRTVRSDPASGGLVEISDVTLIKLGHWVCTQLDRGSSVSQVQAYLAQKLAAASQPNALVQGVGVAIGDSIRTYCPKYASQITFP